jgi:hypothetical protein
MASEDRLNAIKTAIAARLSTVTGIGRIHTYLRWAVQDADFLSLAMTGGVINVWQISRLNTEERWLTTAEVWRAHTIAIYGGYGLMDSNATEETFQNLVERVANRFRSRSAWTLDGLVESTAPYMGELASTSPTLGARGGIQVQSVDHRMVHGKLVHWAELRLGIQELPELLTD